MINNFMQFGSIICNIVLYLCFIFHKMIIEKIRWKEQLQLPSEFVIITVAQFHNLLPHTVLTE